MSVFDTDRLKAAIAAVIREVFPNLAFGGIYAYRVSSAQNGKFSGRPEDPGSGLPDLVDIPIRGPTIGGQSTLTIGAGSSVGVMFLDSDPTRPVLVLGDDASDPTESGLRATSKLTLDSGSGDIDCTVGALFKINGGGDFVAMAAKVDANFTALQAWLSAHVHPTGVGPSGPPAGTPSPQATPCTKLKTD